MNTPSSVVGCSTCGALYTPEAGDQGRLRSVPQLPAGARRAPRRAGSASGLREARAQCREAADRPHAAELSSAAAHEEHREGRRGGRARRRAGHGDPAPAQTGDGRLEQGPSPRAAVTLGSLGLGPAPRDGCWTTVRKHLAVRPVRAGRAEPRRWRPRPRRSPIATPRSRARPAAGRRRSGAGASRAARDAVVPRSTSPHELARPYQRRPLQSRSWRWRRSSHARSPGSQGRFRLARHSPAGEAAGRRSTATSRWR